MGESLVFGLYRDEASLDYAICHLRNVGFLNGNFSVVFPPPGGNSYSDKPETFSNWSEEMIGAYCQHDILLSVRCESSGQAVIARKILECTEADTVLSEHLGGIQFVTAGFSNLV
jgi:hypothetical protein